MATITFRDRPPRAHARIDGRLTPPDAVLWTVERDPCLRQRPARLAAVLASPREE